MWKRHFGTITELKWEKYCGVNAPNGNTSNWFEVGHQLWSAALSEETQTILITGFPSKTYHNCLLRMIHDSSRSIKHTPVNVPWRQFRLQIVHTLRTTVKHRLSATLLLKKWKWNWLVPSPHPNQSFFIEVHNMEMHVQEEERGRGDDKTRYVNGEAIQTLFLIRYCWQRYLFTETIWRTLFKKGVVLTTALAHHTCFSDCRVILAAVKERPRKKSLFGFTEIQHKRNYILYSKYKWTRETSQYFSLSGSVRNIRTKCLS